MRTAIIGGGVIGLSVANRLAENFEDITLFSPQPIEQTTSAAAAAYWAPHYVGYYDRSIASETLTELQVLAAKETSGVCEKEFEEWHAEDMLEAIQQSIDTDYWWQNLPGIQFNVEHVSPYGNQVDGQTIIGSFGPFDTKVTYRSVVARMPDYLRWLECKAVDTGRVTIVRKWIDSLNEVCSAFDQVVHCTGWGAKTLASNDPDTASMRLLAGYAVTVDAPTITKAILFRGSHFKELLLYIIPRVGSVSDVLIGGTAIELTEPISVREPMTFEVQQRCDAIIQRVGQILPGLAEAKVLNRMLGIRPVRKSVRIERDSVIANLIHCYGHGGSGLTMSWGSANRVLKLISESF